MLALQNHREGERRHSSDQSRWDVSVVTKDRIEDQDPIEVDDICIDDVDRTLNPMGRCFRHNAMHAGTARMVLDEYGRCAKCVALGFWKPNG
jgi:hypothetical protein